MPIESCMATKIARRVIAANERTPGGYDANDLLQCLNMWLAGVGLGWRVCNGAYCNPTTDMRTLNTLATWIKNNTVEKTACE